MELENTNFDTINFARASYPDEFAVFTIGSPLIQEVDGEICEVTVKNIENTIDDYSRENSRLEIPINADILPGTLPLEIEPINETESEVLRKLIPNWRQIGAFLIRLDSIKLPSIAPVEQTRQALLDSITH